MTDILDRLDAAIEEADAGTDALCAEYFAGAMESVRDLLDGSNGGYVAPQNRAEMPRLIVQPLRSATVVIRVDMEALRRSANQMVEAFQRLAAAVRQPDTARAFVRFHEAHVAESKRREKAMEAKKARGAGPAGQRLDGRRHG